jgi:hypothetical protein
MICYLFLQHSFISGPINVQVGFGSELIILPDPLFRITDPRIRIWVHKTVFFLPVLTSKQWHSMIDSDAAPDPTLERKFEKS